jgi:ABC-type Fe3+/spermidine/putrescine transport system ATPase subunit
MTGGPWKLRVGRAAADRAALDAGAAAAIVVRPERIRIARSGGEGAAGANGGANGGANAIEGTVDDVLNLGPDTKYQVVLETGQRVAVREPRGTNGGELSRGDRVRLSWPVEDGLLVADPGS